MRRRDFAIFVTVLIPMLAYSESACLTTVPPTPPFTPPVPYNSIPAGDGAFWYGTDALWTQLGVEGVWHTTNNVDKSGGYVTKLIFWRKGFDWRKELEPELIVTARRTDGDAPAIAVAHANAISITSKTPAIMTGIDIPSPGCWELTTYYRGHSLTFTVLVAQ